MNVCLLQSVQEIKERVLAKRKHYMSFKLIEPAIKLMITGTLFIGIIGFY